jgi:hypothetical protein
MLKLAPARYHFLRWINETMNTTRKTTNKTRAIVIAMPAMPNKPNAAASNAMSRKINV